MKRKRKLTIPRTIIDGIVHRPCTRCGDLFPEDKETRCKKCRAEIRLEKRKKKNLKLYGTEDHPQRKNAREVERKQIGGVDWLKCVCGNWFLKSETIGAKCDDCRRDWANDYYRKYYAANKNKASLTDSEKEKIESEEKLRELELNGELPIIGGVFNGVSIDAKNAMESEDFKAFMKFEPIKNRLKMDRNQWTKRNNGEYIVPSTKKKKNKDNFEPNQDFLDQARSDFLAKGGKIKKIINEFVEC